MTADAVGGVWTYVLDLAAGLAREGVSTVLAVTGPAPSREQATAAAAIPDLVLRMPPHPLDWLATDAKEVRAAGTALAALAAREPGVELVQLNSPAYGAGVAFPVPVVAVSHSCLATWWAAMRAGPMPEDFRWRAALVSQGLASATAVVAPSVAFARMTARAHALAAAPCVVRNGRTPMDLPQSAPADFAFTAGRLWDEGKDVAAIDRAAGRLEFPVFAAGATQGPNGAGIALPHLRLTGPLGGVALAGWLARRPVFVSMARYEPFGLAVLEAAQAGCALVLADTPVFRELWDGVARFVPPGDDAALASTLSTLVPDREARAALGEAAMARAGHYSVAAMTRGMLAVYAAALRQGLSAERAA